MLNLFKKIDSEKSFGIDTKPKKKSKKMKNNKIVECENQDKL